MLSLMIVLLNIAGIVWTKSEHSSDWSILPLLLLLFIIFFRFVFFNNLSRCCTGCQRALFCDKRCQTLAWKDHKFECRGIRANGGNMPELEVRLLGRIVARHKVRANNEYWIAPFMEQIFYVRKCNKN